MAVATYEDIVGFDVTMDDASFVSGTEPLCNLRGDLRGLTLRKWPGSQPLPKSLAFQKLGDDETYSWQVSFADGFSFADPKA